MKYEQMLKWAERKAPRMMRRDTLSLVLIAALGSEDIYAVASLDDVTAISDPNSFRGRLLRPHVSLLALPGHFHN